MLPRLLLSQRLLGCPCLTPLADSSPAALDADDSLFLLGSAQGAAAKVTSVMCLNFDRCALLDLVEH
jgi:hypothetical protein